MLGVLFLVFASFFLFRLLGGAPMLRLRTKPRGQSAAAKIEELTEFASRLRAANKYTRAEKIYLQILKIDHHHVATYSRLGTLYSAQKNYGDAVECFQIASRLDPSGPTNYNLGLALFENRNYDKAIAAFEKAIMFEPTLQRYVGLAKAYKKLNETNKMIDALEQAAALEPNTKVLWLLADVYESEGRDDEAAEVHQRIKAADPRDKRLRLLKTASNRLSATSR